MSSLMAQNSVTGMRVGAVTIDESPGLRLVIETQSPLQTQYYALAIGFSVVIAINETPIAGTILIILSFVPNIQATPPLLWLAYRIMIHDERVEVHRSSHSNLPNAPTSPNSCRLKSSSTQKTYYDPNLMTSLKAAQTTTWD